MSPVTSFHLSHVTCHLSSTSTATDPPKLTHPLWTLGLLPNTEIFVSGYQPIYQLTKKKSNPYFFLQTFQKEDFLVCLGKSKTLITRPPLVYSIRGCSHMMSAKNCVVQTSPPPLISKYQNNCKDVQFSRCVYSWPPEPLGKMATSIAVRKH